MTDAGQADVMDTVSTSAAILGAVSAYAIAAGLLTVLPGPDTAIVLATAIDRGRRDAVGAAFGVAVALLVWAAAASAGVAALLRASAELFTVFRIVCIAYLVWLAIRALRGALRQHRAAPASPGVDRPDAGETVPAAHAPRRKGGGFRRALVTGLLNPKLGVFFVVFLPQFVPRNVPTVPMTMLLGAVQAAEALVWYLLVGAIATAASRLLSRRSVRRAIEGATGAVFLFFAGRLALDA
ncbi:LysE family translocator [Microbacterium sp. 8M]|uniref:LysE family translocator n=1 Tax=Microbacterium sp. 8M TaxID=2653153 RepID=UPI0013585D11|nr:LysE family translocator [Microbacterium sp. 8M]